MPVPSVVVAWEQTEVKAAAPELDVERAVLPVQRLEVRRVPVHGGLSVTLRGLGETAAQP